MPKIMILLVFANDVPPVRAVILSLVVSRFYIFVYC